MCLLNGVNSLEFEQVVSSFFEQSEKQNKPNMTPTEFKEKLRTCPLGLTYKDISLVMGHLRIGMDSIITRETVLTSTFNVLAQRQEDSLVLQEVQLMH